MQHPHHDGLVLRQHAVAQQASKERHYNVHHVGECQTVPLSQTHGHQVGERLLGGSGFLLSVVEVVVVLFWEGSDVLLGDGGVVVLPREGGDDLLGMVVWLFCSGRVGMTSSEVELQFPRSLSRSRQHLAYSWQLPDLVVCSVQNWWRREIIFSIRLKTDGARRMLAQATEPFSVSLILIMMILLLILSFEL